MTNLKIWSHPNTSFFSGLLIGFSLMSFAGFHLHTHETGFENYIRLTKFIDDTTLYQPTSQQLYATAKSNLPKDIRNIVVISGDSVLHGFGQRPRQLWSRALQEKLGAKFYVINLARPAGSYMDNGAPIAAALLAEGYNVTLIFNEWPTNVYGTSRPYRQIYWDAVFTNLIQRFPDYDKIVQPQDNDRLSKDIRIGLWLDSVFHFRALWSHIAYNYFSVIWTPDAGFARRRDFQDAMVEPEILPLDVRYPPSIQAAQMEAVKYKIRTACPTDASTAQEYKDGGDLVRSTFRRRLPEALRRRSLVLSIYDSSYYLNRDTLSLKELDCYRRSFDGLQGDYESTGYKRLIVDSLKIDDYRDRAHLTESGGRKLADIVAQELLK